MIHECKQKKKSLASHDHPGPSTSSTTIDRWHMSKRVIVHGGQHRIKFQQNQRWRNFPYLCYDYDRMITCRSFTRSPPPPLHSVSPLAGFIHRVYPTARKTAKKFDNDPSPTHGDLILSKDQPSTWMESYMIAALRLRKTIVIIAVPSGAGSRIVHQHWKV